MNDHTSLELAVPLYFPLDFLLYVHSGSLSGKEQTAAIALAAPCSLFCYLLRIQNIKAHCFSYSLGGNRGDLYHKSTTQLKPTFFIHISFQFCLNSKTSKLMFFLFLFFCDSLVTCNSSHLLSSIKLWPWPRRLPKIHDQLYAQMYQSERASFKDEVWNRLWTDQPIKIEKKMHPDKPILKVYREKYQGKKTNKTKPWVEYVPICLITLLVLKWSIMLS